jgi:hypothetical protein
MVDKTASSAEGIYHIVFDNFPDRENCPTYNGGLRLENSNETGPDASVFVILRIRDFEPSHLTCCGYHQVALSKTPQ